MATIWQSQHHQRKKSITSGPTSPVTTRHTASTSQLSFLVHWCGWAGVMDDREAAKESGLSELVEKLLGLLYCIGDCAYTPTEHLIPIYGVDNATKSQYDNYNFYASQLRIHIEMSFGLMVKRWGILS